MATNGVQYRQSVYMHSPCNCIGTYYGHVEVPSDENMAVLVLQTLYDEAMHRD